MAKRPKPQKDKYEMAPDFERLVAHAAMTSVKFWECVGHALDPERMPSKLGRDAVETVRFHAKRHGKPCPSAEAADQAAFTRYKLGKISFEEYGAIQVVLRDPALKAAAEAGLDEATSQAAELVREFAQREAVETVSGARVVTPDNLIDAAARFERAAMLGSRRATTGERLHLTPEDLEACMRPVCRDYLPTGVEPLDALIGGLERPGLGLVIGGTGDGKSLFLESLAVAAVLDGFDVAYLSLEMPVDSVKRRFYANLLGMTFQEMDGRPDEAARRLRRTAEEGVGEVVIAYDAPRAATPATLRRWLLELKRDGGFNPHVVIVDYADLMASGRKMDAQHRTYEEMNLVFEGLKDIAVERDGWVWTASQTNRGSVRRRKVDLDATADSMGKVRNANLALALSRTDEDCEDGTIRIRAIKHREGVSHVEVGPLPMDASRSRIVAVDDRKRLPWEAASL